MTAHVTMPAADTIPYGSELHHRITGYLIHEALLLDSHRLLEWLEQLDEDLLYTAPIQVTRWNDAAAVEGPNRGLHFNDDYNTVKLRVRRFTESKSVWSENPRSRARRFISNVSAWRTDKPDEYAVTSYVLLTKSKGEDPTYQLVTAQRNDLLRESGAGLKLARREIVIDQSVLGVPNLVSFL